MQRILIIVVTVFWGMLCFAQDNIDPNCGPGNTPVGGMVNTAHMPSRCMFTQMSSTPSSNFPVKYVAAADNLQGVLDTAIPGDSIVLDSAGSWAGPVNLPCGLPGRWITIRSSNYALLPDEFTQITPGFIGQLPKISMNVSNATVGGSKGCFVRITGIEITRFTCSKPTGDPSCVVYNLINMSGSHDIIFDRDIIHGNSHDETARGAVLNNAQNITFQDDYMADFHCISAVGACGDSQCISGGGSTQPDGNFKIVNTYCEASGENILFGGSSGSVVTCDIEVSYNVFNKPTYWDPWSPDYTPPIGKDGLPHPWIVKNHFELKNGCRVHFNGNRLTNVWGGFSQVGSSRLYTPKNPGGAGPCSVCSVTDVIDSNNYTSYAGQAWQIGYGTSDNHTWAADLGRLAIFNNLTDHLQNPSLCYGCGSYDWQISSGWLPAPNIPPSAVHDLDIYQNTTVNDGWMAYGQTPVATNAQAALNTGNPPVGATPVSINLNFYNNSIDVGAYGAYSTGGGANNCWSPSGSKPLATFFSTCWVGGSFIGNNLVSTVPWKGYLPWPPNNGTIPGAGVNMAQLDVELAKHH